MFIVTFFLLLLIEAMEIGCDGRAASPKYSIEEALRGDVWAINAIASVGKIQDPNHPTTTSSKFLRWAWISRGLVDIPELASMYGMTAEEMKSEQQPTKNLLKKFLRLESLPEIEPLQHPWENLPAMEGESEALFLAFSFLSIGILLLFSV